ncbi:ATP-binding protein [Methylocapsa aurea]|uniref:ATP-binding protein n=1 Tax=Methylocapsa aurea TaxID=663610 RepID=UPI00068EC3CD|nr:ATP-binding protein [Methylocapsa aurea]
MTGLPANIANFVKQEIRIAKSRPLLPVFEAVSNALDAISEREGNGTIYVTVLRHPPSIIDATPGDPHTFIIEDDGVGFNDANMGGFDQLYTDRKQPKGGKGRGRFAYLKVFEDVEIESTYVDGAGELRHRKFKFDLSYSGNKAEQSVGSGPLTTIIRLRSMRPEYASHVPKEAATIAREFMSHFLPVLLAASNIEIVIIDGEKKKRLREEFRADFLISSRDQPFVIGSRTFMVTLVKLRPKIALRHRLILAASLREVHSDYLDKYLPVLATGPLELDGEPEGFWLVAIVQGSFLNESVDPMRVTFTDESIEDAPLDIIEASEQQAEPTEPATDLFGEPKSIRVIRADALKIVRDELEPYIEVAVRVRSRAIEAYISRDGLGYHFLKAEAGELARNLRSTDDQAIESSLHAAAFKERRKRNDQAYKLLSATPKEKSEDEYFDKWARVVDSIGDVAKSDLANYVLHRRVIIDLVENILRTTPEGDYRREEVVHSIVFPRGRQSGEVGTEQQNLWLIDERLAFHEHLFSDLTIGRVTGHDVESRLRPDLAIYESGFASFHDGAKPPTQLVLVELKQPGRTTASRDDPVSKTLSYVRQLKEGRAKTEGGAVIDIEPNALTTVYILADWTNDFKAYLDREEFLEMPGDVGRYRYRPRDNIMFVAMSFARLLEGARRRNKIFFRRLGIEQGA